MTEPNGTVTEPDRRAVTLDRSYWRIIAIVLGSIGVALLAVVFYLGQRGPDVDKRLSKLQNEVDAKSHDIDTLKNAIHNMGGTIPPLVSDTTTTTPANTGHATTPTTHSTTRPPATSPPATTPTTTPAPPPTPPTTARPPPPTTPPTTNQCITPATLPNGKCV